MVDSSEDAACLVPDIHVFGIFSQKNHHGQSLEDFAQRSQDYCASPCSHHPYLVSLSVAY